jgi:hypothetical protein
MVAFGQLLKSCHNLGTSACLLMFCVKATEMKEMIALNSFPANVIYSAERLSDRAQLGDKPLIVWNFQLCLRFLIIIQNMLHEENCTGNAHLYAKIHYEMRLMTLEDPLRSS